MKTLFSVQNRVVGYLVGLGRSRLGRLVVSWIFTHMSFALPVHRLRETESLLAFHHPRPAYLLHILLVPKRAVGKLTDLSDTDTLFLAELFETVSSLVNEFDLEKTGYRLIVNGGRYQEFPHLHFHLIADSPPTTQPPNHPTAQLPNHLTT